MGIGSTINTGNWVGEHGAALFRFAVLTGLVILAPSLRLFFQMRADRLKVQWQKPTARDKLQSLNWLGIIALSD